MVASKRKKIYLKKEHKKNHITETQRKHNGNTKNTTEIQRKYNGKQAYFKGFFIQILFEFYFKMSNLSHSVPKLFKVADF